RVADDDGAGRVEGQRVAVAETDVAQVGHLAAAPEERVCAFVAGGVRLADDLSRFVDGVALAPVAAEGAEAGHRAVLPEEGAVVAGLVIRVADDLAARVD